MQPTRARYTVLALLGSLAFLTYFDRVCITRVEGDIRSELGVTSEQMGLVMGAFWLAYALFELPAGWMGDRFGARRTIGRIVLAWSLFTALSGCAAGFWSLLVWRFLFGVGEAGAFPNVARVQAQWLPVATRGRTSGLLWLLARWGGAAAPLVLGGMLAVFQSSTFRQAVGGLPGGDYWASVSAWRFGFWASGLVGAVWVAVWLWWFRDDPAEHAGVNRAELELITGGSQTARASHAMPAAAWGELFRSRTLWAMGLYYLCGSFGWSFFVSWMPRYYNEVLEVPYQKSEWMSAGPLFFGGLACLLGGWLSQALVRRTGWRWAGRALFPLAGASTAALCMLSIRYVHDPQTAALVMCAAAFSYDFGQAANWSTIVDVGGKYAGVAAGLINLVGNLGNAFQPVIGQLIIRYLGWDRLFIVYGCCYLLAALMWLLIDPRKTFYREPAAAG